MAYSNYDISLNINTDASSNQRFIDICSNIVEFEDVLYRY